MIWKYSEGCKDKAGFFYYFPKKANDKRTLFIVGFCLPIYLTKKIYYRSFFTGNVLHGSHLIGVKFYFRVRRYKNPTLFVSHLGIIKIPYKTRLISTEEELQDQKIDITAFKIPDKAF